MDLRGIRLEGVDWIHLAQTLVNTAMNLRIPQKAENRLNDRSAKFGFPSMISTTVYLPLNGDVDDYSRGSDYCNYEYYCRRKGCEELELTNGRSRIGARNIKAIFMTYDLYSSY
jgi:hypothetical protein